MPTLPIETPAAAGRTAVRREDNVQVVLHNDDVNDMLHVVLCLMRVFGHNEALAVKIMMEAHDHARAVAEVEPETPALLHRDQLRSQGLVATVEAIE